MNIYDVNVSVGLPKIASNKSPKLESIEDSKLEDTVSYYDNIPQRSNNRIRLSSESSTAENKRAVPASQKGGIPPQQNAVIKSSSVGGQSAKQLSTEGQPVRRQQQ